MFDINKKSSDIEKSLADVMKLEKQKREARISKEELEESSLKVALQLQRLNDNLEGNIRSANIKEFPAVYVINASESLDDSYPFLVPFNIISEMTKIVSIKLSFWFLNFRAYAKSATEKEAVSSGPSSEESSSGGGGETPTTSDGGSSNPTTSSKTTPSGGGSTTPSGGGSTSGSGGQQTSSAFGFNLYGLKCSTWDDGSRVHIITSLSGVWFVPEFDHYAGIKNHTHTVSNHTHSTPNHTHSTPNHTHPAHSHTVTIADHNHTVTIAEHTHDIPHTHSVPAHSHDITYGIFEEENSPTIQVFISRDNGKTYSLPLGSYTSDQQLDITRFIDTAGDKMIKFTSTTRARLGVQITIKLNTKVR